MRDEQHQKNGDTEIGREKRRRVPLAREEDREAVEQQQERENDHVDMHRVRLQDGSVRQIRYALRLAGPVEPDKHETEAEPGDEDGAVG